MKLLLDMNVPQVFLPFLWAAGYDAHHWSSVGLIEALDSAIMEYALEHNYVVVTSDLDFGEILSATHLQGPSVVLMRPHFAVPEHIIEQLLTALSRAAFFLEEGALVVVEKRRIRIRELPL